MLRIRLMTVADLPLGMRLKDQAGWNQTEADWRRLLDLEPDGCFVAELDGLPVGTTATCVFGSVAWVAMVLVDGAVRGRGIGRALMSHALAFLDSRGVRCTRLDATPLGRPIYQKLGFVGQYELARYEGVLPQSDPVAGVEPVRPDQFSRLLQLDREITGTDRGKLLHRLYEERPGDMVVVQGGGDVAGYLTARAGSRAFHIGPCLARAGAGPPLFAAACHRYAGRPVVMDIPQSNAAAVVRAGAMGLTIQRPLWRMCRGEWVHEHIQDLWASSGPEKG
ncbi:MAG TPA: GNAT family N-acetyltransferase [Gemmataceae bacterium]|jgi:GNAT superfamily N-acetyltransferase|nr:GNAT family N-acetyltransferase [Gemmataceae bacterium]